MSTTPEPIRILVIGSADNLTRMMIRRAAERMSETIELIYADADKHADGDIVITGTGPNLVVIDDPRPLEAVLARLERLPKEIQITQLPFEAGFQAPLPEHKPTCYAPKGSQGKVKKTFTCTGRIRGNYY